MDEVIETWAVTNVKKLFDKWAGKSARFAYSSGLRPFEYFQISINPPCEGHVVISARSIDTDDDTEFEREWEGATDKLAAMLNDATKTVMDWIKRSPANDS
ncbi:MAG: hypothetical protein J0I47_15390 [Sphingomonas sp.]|uniref:hypothetical protein n=1 Tax=Sphingomonas sp. TaxID=28214 RepID=UPI001AC1CD68|nr:hypothetical protein [Sphingomonas sp.]MBN8809602.1 hypothetical protein [Sphingomonas sp.]